MANWSIKQISKENLWMANVSYREFAKKRIHKCFIGAIDILISYENLIDSTNFVEKFYQ